MIKAGEVSNHAGRVIRGGSWINNGSNTRSAFRNYNEPDNRNNNLGLRLFLAQNAVGMSVNDPIFIRFYLNVRLSGYVFELMVNQQLVLETVGD